MGLEEPLEKAKEIVSEQNIESQSVIDEDDEPKIIIDELVKKCPDCAEEIKFEARKCRYWGYRFDVPKNKHEEANIK